MTVEAWLTIGVICLVIAGLMSNRISPDVAMMGGLTLLMLSGVLEPIDAIGGFAHPAVVMIAALFVVAAGLTETGAMEMVAQRVLGRPGSLVIAQLRLMVPVAAMSAFMNNTAVVAMYMPITNDWCRRHRISPSKLFIPLSYAAILGGTCTLIATASNVTISGLYSAFLNDAQNPIAVEMKSTYRLGPAPFWLVTWVGLPVALIGIGFIVLASRWLLPERKSPHGKVTDERQYQVEMTVEPSSPIVGKTIEEAGLRHLPGLYLSEIERGNDILPAVGPDERLAANDRLSFVGIVESVVDLRKIRGLVPATDQVRKIKMHRRNRALVEAVISNASPLVGRTVRTSRFRTRYNAAIIAVHRRGQRLRLKIGDVILQPGDTLLMEAHQGFVNTYRNSRDFYLVSRVEGVREVRHERAWLALSIMALMVVMLVMSTFEPLICVLIGAGLMVGTRCVTGTIARNSISFQVLIVIGAALGIGRAMTDTGAASHIAAVILNLGQQWGSYGLLFLIFMLTSLFGQLITNNGAAVLMFPIAMTVAYEQGVNPVPFVVCLMVAAACNFMSPVAYQTNLMVYGPGGYRFVDYLRIGVPLTLIVGVVSTLLAPAVFPFIATG